MLGATLNFQCCFSPGFPPVLFHPPSSLCRRYPDVVVHRLLQAAIELAQQLGQPDNIDLLSAPIADSAELPAPVPTTGVAAATAVTGDPGGHSNGCRSSNSRQPAVGACVAVGAPTEVAGSEEEGEENAAAAEAAAAKKAAAAALLAKHQLPDQATLAKIAKHSNDTKYSARMASDGSLKLYLCIMLKQQPVVTWAVATTLGGDKFCQAYLPEFGCE